MSYEIGKAALNLQWTERVARIEYVDNWEIVRHYTGRDPRTDPGAWKEFNDRVHLDVIWSTHAGPKSWAQRGRVTDMGHASYMEDGSDFHAGSVSPFHDAQEVLSFNAVEEYGLIPFEDLVAFYEEWYRQAKRDNDQVVTGGYYQTLVSGAIEAFGWDLLLEAAGDDADRFGSETLEGIFQQTLHHCKAWAKTSIEFYMCHDDMVWTQGPFMNPAFYRQYIFPRYKKMWSVLKDAGKKVIFCSDGTFDMFLDDIVEAGADGFCFEPTNDLSMMVDRYGQSMVLMGGADCRTLSFGTRQDVDQELQRIFKMARECPGFVFATGNHFPSNIPLDIAIYYFDRIEELGLRNRASKV